MNTKLIIASAMLGLSVALGGCFEDQERQIAACKVDAERAYPLAAGERPEDKWDFLRARPAGSAKPLMNNPRTGLFIDCMNAHGYVHDVADDRCPMVPLIDYNEAWINPYCYQPRHWLGKVAYRIETDAHFCGARVDWLTGAFTPAPNAQQTVGSFCTPK